ARWSWKKFDAITETSQFADHLALADLLGFGANGRPSLFVADALVQDLPDQSRQPVGDGTDGLGVPEARDEPSVDEREDRALGCHRCVCGLIRDAPHLAVTFGTAVAVVHSGILLTARTRAHPRSEVFG